MKLIDEKGNVVENLNLGIVSVGKSKEYQYWLLNDSGTLVKDIEISIESDAGKELKILDSPETLSDKQKGSLRLKWSPDMKIRGGLRAKISIKAVELWGIY